jgi:hypothetical protein
LCSKHFHLRTCLIRQGHLWLSQALAVNKR